MHHLRTFAAAALLVMAGMAFTPGNASAQFDLGARAGYDLEVEELFLGVEGRFAMPVAGFPIQLNPAADYFLVDDLTVMQFEVNALYPFGVDNATFTPYAGAGLGVTYMSYDNEYADLLGIDTSDTDFGLNVIGGAVFGSGSMRPFAQARIKLGGDLDIFSVMGGVLFRLGQ